MIERGEGSYLFDADGRRYLDGTAALWCNVHGHRHPAIDAAIASSSTGSPTRPCSASPTPAPPSWPRGWSTIAPPGLTRVFYSDSGSTAAEIALKMAFQYQQQRGGEHARRTSFVRLREAYHGDTIGSVSVGGIDLFHSTYRPLLFETHAAEPGDAADLERILAAARRRGRGGDRRAAGPGRRRDARPAARLPARGARALRPPRRAADLRRGGDRLRPHRDDVRLRAGGRRARPPLPRQGDHRRLPAAGGDADHARRSTRASSAPPRSQRPSSTATPTPATRSPARRRWPTSTSSSRSGRSSACSRRSPCSRSCWPRSRRCPRWPRCASAASWSASTSASTTPALRMGHRVTLEARERGAFVRPLGDTVVLMPPLSISEDELRELVAITADSIRAAVAASSPSCLTLGENGRL